MDILPLATKVMVKGCKDGQEREYQRYTIEGHGDTLYTHRFQTGKNTKPLEGDVHARYATKQGDRTASFHPLAVPNDPVKQQEEPAAS